LVQDNWFGGAAGKAVAAYFGSLEFVDHSVGIIGIQFDSVPSPAIPDEDAGVVIRHIILQSAPISDEQTPGADLFVLQSLELESIPLFPGKLLPCSVEGIFFPHLRPVRATDYGQPVIDTVCLRVLVFFMVKINVLVLTILIEGEGDIGILPSRYAFPL
jgi:hypothetical protein